MLQLHQQQAWAGSAPADVDQILALFGLTGLSSAPGFEFATSSKTSSESGSSADDQLADLQAELDAELERLASDDGGSAAAAAALSDGPSAAPDVQKPLDDETLAKLLPGITAGAFWLSPLGKEKEWLVYFRCSECDDQSQEDVPGFVKDLVKLQIDAARFSFVCKDCE